MIETSAQPRRLLSAAVLFGLAAASVVLVLHTSPDETPADVRAAMSKANVVYGLTPTDRALLVALSSEHALETTVAIPPEKPPLRGPLLSTTDTVPSPALGELNRSEAGAWTIFEPEEYAEVGRFPPVTRARVRLRRHDGENQPCELDADGRHVCTKDSWAYVGERRVRVGGEDMDCIWAHPLGEGVVDVRYPPVRSPKKGQWVVEFALDDRAIGTGNPVDVDLRYGGEQIRHTHRDRKGWSKVRLPRSESASALSLAISAEKPGRRHFCYRVMRSGR